MKALSIKLQPKTFVRTCVSVCVKAKFPPLPSHLGRCERDNVGQMKEVASGVFCCETCYPRLEHKQTEIIL